MQPQTGGEQPNTEGLNLLGTHKRTDMKTINLLILWFQLRALEATMYGQEEALTDGQRRQRTKARGEPRALLF